MAYIFLSVPILDRPEFKMVHSMYQAILSCKEHKVRLFVNEGDSLVSRIRNVHMSLFLDQYKECDYFVSLDSDLEIVNCYNTNNLFSKLIAHDKDFVGGLYALKQPVGEAQTSSLPLDISMERSKMPFDSGLVEMRWLSAGCWCIKRSAVEKMVNAYPELDYVGDDNVSGRNIHGLYIPQIFNIKDENTGKSFNKYLSEDWAFVERWRKIGGKVWADSSIVLNHIGKYPYKLWNVEVVAKKAEDAQKLNVEKLPPLVQDAQPHLPPAGWNLNMEKHNK